MKETSAIKSIRELGDICDERIKVCLDACVGITNEALESGVVGEMVEFLKDLERAMSLDTFYMLQGNSRRDAILAKLEGK